MNTSVFNIKSFDRALKIRDADNEESDNKVHNRRSSEFSKGKKGSARLTPRSRTDETMEYMRCVDRILSFIPLSSCGFPYKRWDRLLSRTRLDSSGKLYRSVIHRLTMTMDEDVGKKIPRKLLPRSFKCFGIWNLNDSQKIVVWMIEPELTSTIVKLPCEVQNTELQRALSSYKLVSQGSSSQAKAVWSWDRSFSRLEIKGGAAIHVADILMEQNPGKFFVGVGNVLNVNFASSTLFISICDISGSITTTSFTEQSIDRLTLLLRQVGGVVNKGSIYIYGYKDGARSAYNTYVCIGPLGGIRISGAVRGLPVCMKSFKRFIDLMMEGRFLRMLAPTLKSI